ncbi:uncharacterized protein METZ01_LOCUS166444 [marine metagenome]|uniref:4-hydroxy-tetrahydrodipicolinate synthase n=1 Tax=marine metagenome TaxID=408172 RepID=A0A382BIC2_9ZZZZ
MAEIGRLLTAMVTPFTTTGEVDYVRAREISKKIIKNGSDGLVIGGTTGEAPSMSDEEKLNLYKEVKDAIGDEGTVIAGTTDNNTRKSVELSISAEKLGVDALLLTVPAYNKPTQGGLIGHFKEIAGSVKIPGILYNVPSRTALNMDLDTTLELSEIPNIIGTKEASSDADQINYIIKNASDAFKVWSGNDNETFSIISAGGYGVVSVAGNLISAQVKHLIGLILEGNIELAAKEHLRLLPLFNALFFITNPIPVRYAMNRCGLNVGSGRLPMIPSDDELQLFAKKFDPVMDEYDIDVQVG